MKRINFISFIQLQIIFISFIYQDKMSQLQEEKDDIKEKKREDQQQMINNIQANSQLNNQNIIKTQLINDDNEFTSHKQNHKGNQNDQKQQNQDNQKQQMLNQQTLEKKQQIVGQTINEEKKVMSSKELDAKRDEGKQQQQNDNFQQQGQEQELEKQQQHLSEVRNQQQKKELIDSHVNTKDQKDKWMRDEESHNSIEKQEDRQSNCIEKKEDRQSKSQQHNQNQQQSQRENQQLIQNIQNTSHDQQQQQNFLVDNEQQAKEQVQQQSNLELSSIHTNHQYQQVNFQNNQQQSHQQSQLQLINSNNQTPKQSQSQSIKNNPTNSNQNHIKTTIEKHLIIAYYTYVLDHHSTTNTIFDKQQIFKKPLMDLTLFLKFYKDFNLKSMLQANQVIKVFKKTAINHLWLDVELLINIIMSITGNKFDQQKHTIVKVNDQNQINQRFQILLSLFNKQKVKKHLKGGYNKQLWQQILKLYNQRNLTNITVERSYQNKSQVVGKFLQRNFDQQVPKWLQKKQKQLPLITNTDSRSTKKDTTNNKQSHIKQMKLKQSHIKQMKHSSTPNDNDIGDQQQSISNRIQKLRSKSQKSITNLKKLIKINDQTINNEINKLVSRKSFINQNYTEPNTNNNIEGVKLNSNKKKQPLHKNKHKNTQSVQRQIQNFLNQENSKLLKSQKHLFLNQLKIIDQEPFLSQYFSSEINLKNSLINVKNNVDRKGIIQKSNQNKNLIQDKRINNKESTDNITKKKSLDVLPKIKAKINPSEYSQRKIVNKFSKDKNDRNQQILSLNSYKGKIVRSQPSYYQQQRSLLGLNENQKRPKARSLRKDSIQNQNNKESIQLNRINKILSQKMDDGSNMKMSEKKLYEYLAKNKQVIGMNSKNLVNLVNKDIIGSKKRSISVKKIDTKINPNLVSSNSPSIKKGLQQQVPNKKIKKLMKDQKQSLPQQKRHQKQKLIPSNIKNISPSANLLNNYRQQVYELYKNVKNSYHHSPQEKEIILKQKLKRKGYVKELNNPQYLK